MDVDPDAEYGNRDDEEREPDMTDLEWAAEQESYALHELGIGLALAGIEVERKAIEYVMRTVINGGPVK